MIALPFTQGLRMAHLMQQLFWTFKKGRRIFFLNAAQKKNQDPSGIPG